MANDFHELEDDEFEPGENELDNFDFDDDDFEEEPPATAVRPPITAQQPQRHSSPQFNQRSPQSQGFRGPKPTAKPFSVGGHTSRLEVWFRTQGKSLAIFACLSLLFGLAEYYAATLAGFWWFAGIFIVQVLVSWSQLSVLARLSNYRDMGGLTAKILVFGFALYMVALLLDERAFFIGYALYLITFFWPGAYAKDRKAPARFRV